MRYVLSLSAILLWGAPLPAQLVPEDIHTDATGPSEMCGITAADAQQLEATVKANANARMLTETDRYLAYEGPMERTVWNFAKPSNFAYPLTTCIRVFEENGAVMTQREMRCDATREACDRAFLEFEGHDKKVLQSIKGEGG